MRVRRSNTGREGDSECAREQHREEASDGEGVKEQHREGG